MTPSDTARATTSAPASQPAPPGGSPLRDLPVSVLNQCIHCGFCLPTCPTYDLTKHERHSPRGRIALMRGVAEGRLEVTPEFGKEMYDCLGCLACVTACPAGVDYARLIEAGRHEAEHAGVLANPRRSFLRRVFLRHVFLRPWLMRTLGRLLYIWQVSDLQVIFRGMRLHRLLPPHLQRLEAATPAGRRHFSRKLVAEVERPAVRRYRVGLLIGCVQDILLSEINRDTADVLVANGCEVLTPRDQGCCGSIHAHNGDLEGARIAARRLLDAFPVQHLDAIISNAGGCGSHLRHFDQLLADDRAYAERARLWSQKLRDIHEWLVEIDFRAPLPARAHEGAVAETRRVCYHESCHLTHGQKVAGQPRAVLEAVPGIELVDLPESSWCCGSAGIYSITHPETADVLLDRKMKHVNATKAVVVATANPGCHLQLQTGLKRHGIDGTVMHPVSLLAAAYRAEPKAKRRAAFDGRS